MVKHICTNESFYAGTGMTKEDMQFRRWCPYCDKIVTWQHSSPYTDDQKCTVCGFSVLLGDPESKYPKGLNPMTGELLKQSLDEKENGIKFS